MSVQSKKENDKLILELDNGDLREFDKVMEKWSFKDHQSLVRFALSLLVLNENKSFPIKVDNQDRDIIPAPHLLKE
jgi:hypothetical protein